MDGMRFGVSNRLLLHAVIFEPVFSLLFRDYVETMGVMGEGELGVDTDISHIKVYGNWQEYRRA